MLLWEVLTKRRKSSTPEEPKDKEVKTDLKLNKKPNG